MLRALLSVLLLSCGLVAMSESARGKIDMAGAGWLLGPIIDIGGNWYQVRYEQRVIIRIPRQSVTAASMKAGGVRSEAAPIKYKEKKVGKCLWMDRLAGSRPGPKDSLEIITKDGALVRAYLGDGCLAREFYAGAYMERPKDGKLCVDRDYLHARTGAKCEVDRFRLLVPG